MNWEEKLNKFLSDFEHIDKVIGILVCGSYITGHPTNHSDLDVHIILNDDVDFRERGNRIIDGLLIEYFANSPTQIRNYFKEDYESIQLMSQTQFATGKIILDKLGIVQTLKNEAIEMINKQCQDINVEIKDINKYEIWDLLDDLLDMYENNFDEFDFIYYNNLNRLLEIYMLSIKHPYHPKTILGNITSEVTRNKYLLTELPDKEINHLIKLCMTEVTKENRIKNYEILTKKILEHLGGFDINTFVFKSKMA